MQHTTLVANAPLDPRAFGEQAGHTVTGQSMDTFVALCGSVCITPYISGDLLYLPGLCSTLPVFPVYLLIWRGSPACVIPSYIFCSAWS